MGDTGHHRVKDTTAGFAGTSLRFVEVDIVVPVWSH